ncbi:hypothetical protein A9Q74_04790 [Colwellia sp. 39_35_sub15_T18]|nr:hypothetical protein A9Q74_04790 [Colwellia sp. 39_35_sub15_T18]
MKLKYVITTFLLLSISFSSTARIKLGVIWKYEASGFFSPKIDSLIVKEVSQGSLGYESGLLVGDSVISIQDCKIPGCSASKAKGFLKNKKIDTLRMTVKRNNGELVKIRIYHKE